MRNENPEQPRTPSLPPTSTGAEIIYSTWRDCHPHQADDSCTQVRLSYREAATKGHAIDITEHPQSAGCEDTYTEVVSYADPTHGRRSYGVRTVTPGGEELVNYPSPGDAKSAHQDVLRQQYSRRYTTLH